jgi:TolB-like protein
MESTNPAAASIRQALSTALESRTFARAVRSRTLLQYLVEAKLANQSVRLKESSIAVDVFGRSPAAFDGDADGIVRVSANRLREQLARYYSDEGRDAAFKFEIPRGSYAPIIRRAAPQPLPAMPRIVVLPLANFTGDSNNEALCDGLTDDMIDALARLHTVQVLARTSSFRFKDVAKDIRDIANELGAHFVLEGSVQEVGSRLRLTAQMIVAADGTHLWSHSFESDAENRADLQSQLIDLMRRSIEPAVDTQRLSLAPLDAPSASVALSANPEAMLAYHRGLYAYRQDTVDSFTTAVEQLSRAVQLDPSFARAHAALAKTWWARGNSGAEPLAAASRRAFESSRLAHQLAPLDPVVSAAHGYLTFFVGYNPKAARDLAARAVQLGPHCIEAHLFRAKLCTYLQSFDDARKSVATAKLIDPLSLDPVHGEIATAIVSHDYPLALKLTDHLLSFEPNSSVGRWNRGHILRKLGEFDASDKNFEESLRLWPESARYAPMMRCLTRASAGDHAGAAALKQDALEQVPWLEDPMVYAVIDALLGDTEGVLKAWEHAIAEHDPYVYLSYYHEEFDPWRQHPRFLRCAAALGLNE